MFGATPVLNFDRPAVGFEIGCRNLCSKLHETLHTAAWSILLGGVVSERHPKSKPTSAWSEFLGSVASRRHPKPKPTDAWSEFLGGVVSERHSKTKPTAYGEKAAVGIARRCRFAVTPKNEIDRRLIICRREHFFQILSEILEI